MPTKTAVNIKEILYGYRPGFHSPVPAQDAGEALAEQLEETGSLEPKETVRRARSVSSKIHRQFTWDDEEAANKMRLNEARSLIRSTYIVREKKVAGAKKPERVLELQFVNVRTTRENLGLPGSGSISTYIPVERAATDDTMRIDVLSEAMALIRGLQRRIERVSVARADMDFLQRLEREVEEERERRKR